MSLAHERVALATGVELDVWQDGAGEPLIFLHGFPESHRTWRHQMAALADRCRVIAPDQRGYARSSKPEGVEAYAVQQLVADVIALADALGLGRFTLLGHDWGGAVAWSTALAHPERVARLVIANAPHPLVFQRSLIENPAQRRASQYMTAFRHADTAARIVAAGAEWFFDHNFVPHIPGVPLDEEDRRAYLDEWRQPGALPAMLAWYKASGIVGPAPGEAAARPAWIDRPFPVLAMPVLVIWGMRDHALLPVQLDGLDALCRDLTVERIDAGHFVTWGAPEEVTGAIRRFLAARPSA